MLRTYRGIQQSFEKVPDVRLFEAQYDDPQLARTMHERETILQAMEDRGRTEPDDFLNNGGGEV